MAYGLIGVAPRSPAKPRLTVLARRGQHPCVGYLADPHDGGSSGTWVEIAVKHHGRPVDGRLAMKSIVLALIFGAMQLGTICLAVADASGRKELLAIEDGWRESTQSWRELLLRLRDENGLVLVPELATGDGALGFWQALHQVWPDTRQQRCW